MICIFSVTKYHLRFNEHRKFNELEYIDLSKAVDAKNLSESLKGLKWITSINPNSPYQELENLKEVVKFLQKNKKNKTLITDYQILAPISGIYDFSPNQWHHPSVSFPLKGQKYFKDYKNYFVQNIKKNKIEFIYETTENENTITELIINKDCFKKNRVSKMLVRLDLTSNCKDLK